MNDDDSFSDFINARPDLVDNITTECQCLKIADDGSLTYGGLSVRVKDSA